MAYTIKQLTMAWTAVHDGIAPDAATVADLENKIAQVAAGAMTDAQALGYVLNSADKTTALAALSYQFFTGKSPTKEGLAYLVNSPDNSADLNDAYYGKFNIENRYINFSANLGVQGEGAGAFAGKYGAMSFADYIASIYETIIGSTYAKAAGVDIPAAIAYLVSREDAIKATALGAGMITPNMTQAQIDLAVKAAAAGFLMGEAIKSDIGLYAAAANNFMIALAKGDAVYNTDITNTYKPVPGSGAQGTGHTVDVSPPTTTLPGGPPPPPPEPDPQPLSFTLTTGADTFTGANLGDTFTATPTTFNATDVLNGADGNDTLTISGAFNGNYTPAAATFSNIETVNITNTLSGVYVDASGWTGVTKLNVTDKDSTQITASSTTDVTLTNTDQGGYTLTLNGGHDVTYKVSNNTGGSINIGQTTAATGAVVLERTHATNGGYIDVTGGTSIDLTLRATNAVNTTAISNSALLTGTALTTTVKVKGSATITADASTAGNGGDGFNIYDVNRASNSDAGTITSIEADGFSSLTFQGSSLSTLTASHGGSINISSNSSNPTRATTLDATFSGITSSVLDNGVYETLNLTRGADASTFTLFMNALKTLAIGGSSDLTFNTLNTSLLETLTVTGAGKLDAGNLSGLTQLTELDAHGATGAITAYVDASLTKVSTGSGADDISVDGTTVSKAISLGAGDDRLSLAAVTTITDTVDGGAGTNTLFLDGVDAASPATGFGAHVQNFQRLQIDNANNHTIDLTALGGFHYVTAQDGNGATINGFSSGDTLVLDGAGTSYTLGGANFGGASDSFNLLLTGTSAINYGEVEMTGVETLNITSDDTSATPSGAYENRMSLNATGTTSVIVTGDAKLFISTDSANITSIDASGITAGFRLETLSLAATATITGSATKTNNIFFSTATGTVITYEGGSGNDLIEANNGQAGNVFHLGDGTNHFVGRGGTTSAITAGTGDDYIQVTNGGATIQAGNGDNVVIIGANASTSNITTGTGDDEIYVNGGRNVIDVGSGDDYIEISRATGASATTYTEITGIGADDQVWIISNHASVMGARLTGQTSLADYLAVANDVAGTTNTLRWFTVGADLFILSDVSDATTFVDGVDSVIKLAGAASLDLSAATVSNGLITFH